MKDFLITLFVGLIGTIFFYPAIEFILYLFHRENDVSGFNVFLASWVISYIWIDYDQKRKRQRDNAV